MPARSLSFENKESEVKCFVCNRKANGSGRVYAADPYGVFQPPPKGSKMAAGWVHTECAIILRKATAAREQTASRQS
jgi:hypothetical protein